jgi:hypothetical protein
MATTIKISEPVRDRLKDYAEAHGGIGLGAAVDVLLDEAAHRDFWGAVATQVPDEEYRREGDDTVALQDAEEYVTRYETGPR